MSGDPDEFNTPAGQEDQSSPSLGDDISSLLGSVTQAASRLTAHTSEVNQPVRRLDFTNSPTTNTQEEKEQELSSEEQELNMPTASDDPSIDAIAASSATPADSILEAASMFGSTPKDKTTLTGLRPSVTRSDRLTSAKDKQKIKSRYTEVAKSPFDVPSHYVSSQLGESDGASKVNATNIHSAFIATAQKTRELKNRCTEYDIINILMIPRLKDNSDGIAPDQRWDFTNRTHFLDAHAKHDMATCKKWVSDCLLYDASGFEAEDQEWLLDCVRNACSADLRQKVDEDFDKLEFEHRGGVTYLKLMFDVLIFVNDHVITAMQAWIKHQATKGLRMYPNESVREMTISTLAICTRLEEANRLPEDSVQDVLTALCNCSHEKFRKQFDTLRTIRDNSILGAMGATTGSTLEQIKTILNEADKHYNTYSVNDEWKFGKAVYANACFNCGGNHGLQNCTQAKDDGRIERAKNEYHKKKNANGGNNQQQRRNNNNNSNGGNRPNNKYESRGKFRKPDNPREGGEGRKIDGEIHLACAKCGWNDGDSKHTTKYHAAANKAGFSLPDQHPAVLKWGLCGNVADNSSSKSKQSSGNGGSVNFAANIAKLEELEKTSEDHDEVRMAGMMARMLASLKG